MYATHVDSSTPGTLQVAAPHASGHVLHDAFVIASHLHRSVRADTYVATDTRSGDRVVLKCLRTDGASSSRARMRIEREARHLRRVRHPNIVRVLGWHAEPATIVLEHVHGSTLRAFLRDRRVLGLREVAVLGIGLCDALASVHANGLVHVDVKPANIMLRTGTADLLDARRVVLLDFDLARVPGSVGGGLGTRLFASPEQTRGGTIGRATDVWGLGVILHRAASGRLPFTASSGTPQLAERATLLRDDHHVDAELAGLIDAMLHPLAEDRPLLPDVRALLTAQLDR